MKTTKEIPIKIVNNQGTYYYNSKEQLHREDGPAVEHKEGLKEWWINDKRHRTDGPAVEYTDGTKKWWLNNKRHREDGPAIERPTGSREWWLNNKKYTPEEYAKQMKLLNTIKKGSKQAGLNLDI